MAKVQKIKGEKTQVIALHHSPQELLQFCLISAEAVEAQKNPENAELLEYFHDLAALCQLTISAIDHEAVVPFAPNPHGPKS